MPRPRHKNKAIIRLSSHPSRQSLCFDSKLVVVVVVIGLMETRLYVTSSDPKQYSMKETFAASTELSICCYYDLLTPKRVIKEDLVIDKRDLVTEKLVHLK